MCDNNCTAAKNQNQGYANLGTREAKIEVLEEVEVDLISSWRFIFNDIALEFKALTAIDPVMNLLERQQIDDK